MIKTCNSCSKTSVDTSFPPRGNKCKTCVAIYMKAYREQNFDVIAGQKKQWAADNFEHKAKQDKFYAQQNSEKRTVARKKWVAANPMQNQLSKKVWKLKNIGKVKAEWANRRKSIKLQTPAWLTEDDFWMIEQAYELAALRTKLFGFAWHVDHVLPLRGKRISGLHMPYNLQVIPAIDNLRKGNRMEAHNGK